MTVGDVYDLAPGLPATTEFGRSDTKFARFALPYQIAISMLTLNGITFVDGVDPDGNRVLITYPTPEQLPREVIDRRFR